MTSTRLPDVARRIDYERANRNAAAHYRPRKYSQASSAHWPATDKQLRYLRHLCHELGEGDPPDKLNRLQAADLIRTHKKALQKRK